MFSRYGAKASTAKLRWLCWTTDRSVLPSYEGIRGCASLLQTKETSKNNFPFSRGVHRSFIGGPYSLFDLCLKKREVFFYTS